jgi:hypothetical protein
MYSSHCSWQVNLYLFSPVVDENRIVYDWFLPAGQLHRKSEGTPKEEPVLYPTPSATTVMANKSLCEYSVPTVANVPVGPAINTGTGNFKLNTGLITMV